MRAQQQVGKHGQEVAASALRRLGVEMVEEIGTPVHLIPTGNQGAFRVVYGEKVSGDHRGILPGGQSVLAETKTIVDRNLRYSDLREHQPGRLSTHAALGGLSLLVWVHHSGVYIMRWPVPGFEARKSIDAEHAGMWSTLLEKWMRVESESKNSEQEARAAEALSE